VCFKLLSTIRNFLLFLVAAFILDNLSREKFRRNSRGFSEWNRNGELSIIEMEYFYMMK